MAATVASFSLSTTTRVVGTPKPHVTLNFPSLNYPWKRSFKLRSVRVMASPSSPSSLSDKVEESVKAAEEVCAGDAESGECAAAWDEVEEVSAAASHARDKQKNSDPLEAYCKDNPETDECRTYED